jgi:hypothetical protein
MPRNVVRPNSWEQREVSVSACRSSILCLMAHSDYVKVVSEVPADHGFQRASLDSTVLTGYDGRRR